MIDLKLDLKFFVFEIKLNIFETVVLMLFSTGGWAAVYTMLHSK